MCYSNCPYEKWGNPDTAGDCGNHKMMGTLRAHCYEPTCKECGAEEELVDDLCVSCRLTEGGEE